MAINTNAHVLVVDDMKPMRKLVTDTLRKIGFNSFSDAQDGNNAWEVLNAAFKSQKPVELIVCDWNMPGATGLDFLIRVRGADEFKSLPFLMVTAETEKDNIMAAMKAGVSSYILKPFTVATLNEKLEKCFK